jgi:HK97 gp10 family phage protein
MDKITFEVNGFAELYKNFKTLDNKAKDEVKKEFAASALKIQSTAKRLAPINLGNLRNSITVTESGSNTDFVYKINATAKYAPYVEFGTGPMAEKSIPSEYKEYAAKFRGKTGSTFQQMIEAIMLWVKRKGLANGKNERSVAFLIARSILRKGLRPQPFLIPAFEQEKSKLLKRIKEILNA